MLIAQEALQVLKLQSLPGLAESERLRNGKHGLLRSIDVSKWNEAISIGKCMLHV